MSKAWRGREQNLQLPLGALVRKGFGCAFLSLREGKLQERLLALKASTRTRASAGKVDSSPAASWERCTALHKQSGAEPTPADPCGEGGRERLCGQGYCVGSSLFKEKPGITQRSAQQLNHTLGLALNRVGHRWACPNQNPCSTQMCVLT